jgi:hypothetical protein
MDIWEESGNRLIWRSDELLAELRKRGPYGPNRTLICECGWEGKKSKRVRITAGHPKSYLLHLWSKNVYECVCPKCGKSELEYKE